ncbi:MAG: hypothetical protein IJ685_00615, partial [Selenomonadaceae bacterium]|nr:hypothetical protein [Selenomonadaceae bacterium]
TNKEIRRKKLPSTKIEGFFYLSALSARCLQPDIFSLKYGYEQLRQISALFRAVTLIPKYS